MGVCVYMCVYACVCVYDVSSSRGTTSSSCEAGAASCREGARVDRVQSARLAVWGCARSHQSASVTVEATYELLHSTRPGLTLTLVNKTSDTDLGNTMSAPHGGERATVC